MDKIKKIILISGKRKCGKDFISEKLQKRLAGQAQIVRISEPIKTEWAKKLQLDLAELLSDGPYKEQYRKDMIVWSEEVRAQDYGLFCRSAMQNANAEIIIVSDIRRKNDIKWFRETYDLKLVHTLRLTSSEDIRVARGWTFTVGIDDVQSECDLDDYECWDYVVENNNQYTDEQMVNLLVKRFELS